MIVDVYHDIVCPWCRIGKAALDRAVAAWDGEPIEVRWRPSLLNPEAPAGLPIADYLRQVRGVADPAAVFRRVAAAGAPAGLRFRFDLARSAPTQDAHRLLLLTPPAARPALLDRLHRAHFEEGVDIGDHATLARLAADVGAASAEAVVDRLASGEGTAELNEALAEANDVVRGGVPFFVFDNRFAVAGAQPTAVLVEAMGATARAAV